MYLFCFFLVNVFCLVNSCWLTRLLTMFYTETEVDEKILNGKPIEIEKAPYQAWLGHCGAAIISDRYLLTAGHCLMTGVKKVGIGSKFRKKLTNYEVESFEPHSKFQVIGNNVSQYAVYDIGFIKTKKIMDLKTTPAKSILISDKDPSADEVVFLSGWGAITIEAQESPEDLRGLDVFMLNDANCKKAFPQFELDKVICSDHEGTFKHAYKGDSGGPLAFKEKLVGIVSFGSTGGNNVVVYSSIAQFRDWIKNKTGI